MVNKQELFYLCFGKHHLDVQSVFVKINVIEESQLGPDAEESRERV